MSRGWESKDVESQIEAFESARTREPVLSGGELVVRQMRESLLLSRTRVLGDIQRACNPRHKDQLLSALGHLDAELEKLGPPTTSEA